MNKPTLAYCSQGSFAEAACGLSGLALVARAFRIHGYAPRALERLGGPRNRGTAHSEPAITHPLGQLSPVEEALVELGFVIGMNHKVVVSEIGDGYECVLDGYRAVGTSWAEAVVRASLVKSERDQRPT